MGDFEFKKKINGGNFGEIWLARDRALNCECVVKRIPPSKIINQKNFLSEAQILKRAEHPNIVKVFGAGTLDNGDIYISMEHLKGGNLEVEIKNGYMPLSKAVKLMIDVLRGLEYAHSQNIIHRDIKPANILVGNAFEGKLSDFGLAIIDIESLDPHSLQSHKYRTHLAPEVRKIQDFSFLSDIYACGITLYRLVNGDSYIKDIPFEKIKEEAESGRFPNRRLYREFIPQSLKVLINKSISVNPALRHQSAEEMRRALEKIKVCFNWSEVKADAGKKWIASEKTGCYEINRILMSQEKWRIVTKKGFSKAKLRSIKKLCFENLSAKEAVKKTGKLLQSFVSGKSVEAIGGRVTRPKTVGTD